MEPGAGSVMGELFAPLRFAAGAGFSHADRLRGLSNLVDDVARRAGEAGVEPRVLERLRRAARAFDEAKAGTRGPAVVELIRIVGMLVPLPADLAAVAGAPSCAVGESGAARKSEPVPVAAVSPPATPKGGPPSKPKPAIPKAPASTHAGSVAPERATAKTPRSARPKAAAKSGPASPPDLAPDEPILPGPAFTRGPLARELTTVRGVGSATAAAMAKRGITRAGHVLFTLPRTYHDRRHVATIRELVPGEKGLTVGEIAVADEIVQGRSRRKMFRAVLRDKTGRLALTFFHYWPSTKTRFSVGRRLFVWGEVKLFGGVKQIVHPEVEDAELESETDASLAVGRIVGEYRGMAEVGQGRYRTLVRRVLDAHLADVPELLPPPILAKRALPGIREALADVHFPPAGADFPSYLAWSSASHRRLIYEELLLLSVGLALKQRGVRVEPGHAFDVSPESLAKALSILPFAPTGAQRRVIAEIAKDMGAPEPMNRLLQGDVGSGKTAVAAVACALAVASGKQAAVMAPTELLAEQHHRTFAKMLAPSGIEVALLVAGRGKAAMAEARERVASGKAQVAVGTHALFEDESAFADLGLAVVDEQHRFGVAQRARLFHKGRRPDVLVMTATPIPRTLALVLHGELEQSVLDELPPGRTPIITKVVDSAKREKAYEAIDKELAAGRQAYVVYPLIEESETSDLEDATRGKAVIEARFRGRKVELLHGRMKAEEKERAMDAFRARRVDILVATTVVEVGVDVPNATVMLVEHAERFGLSQLHQLRGRVGRGAHRGLCFLVAHGGRTERAAARLDVMERTTDGFEIARSDLEIRGPGEFLGTRQAGLPELTFADLSRDARLLEDARADAFALVAADPDLARLEHRLLREEVFERFRDRMSLARVG